jgi:hypothetical protein
MNVASKGADQEKDRFVQSRYHRVFKGMSFMKANKDSQLSNAMYRVNAFESLKKVRRTDSVSCRRR